MEHFYRFFSHCLTLSQYLRFFNFKKLCYRSHLYCETKVWLISILMITKQGLELMIIFQVWLGKMISKKAITKTKSSKKEINKKKKTSKKIIFQDLRFIGSLCKVVGALGLSYISFFIYGPKSSKCNIVLNILRIGWFHVFN